MSVWLYPYQRTFHDQCVPIIAERSSQARRARKGPILLLRIESAETNIGLRVESFLNSVLTYHLEFFTEHIQFA